MRSNYHFYQRVLWGPDFLSHGQRYFASTSSIKKRSQQTHSGLQKEVISLYRKLLRTCRAKDAENQLNKSPFIQSLRDPSTSSFSIRERFRKQAMEVSGRDHVRIEHHIRQGEKYIKMMNTHGVKSISSSRFN